MTLAAKCLIFPWQKLAPLSWCLPPGCTKGSALEEQLQRLERWRSDPFQSGGTGAVMCLDTDKTPAPPGCSPSSLTAAAPPATPEQTRAVCSQGAFTSFTSLSIKPTKQHLIITSYQDKGISFIFLHISRDGTPLARNTLQILESQNHRMP